MSKATGALGQLAYLIAKNIARNDAHSKNNEIIQAAMQKLGGKGL